MCARVRTPLAAPGLAREQRRVELCAAEQEERRRRERQGGGKDGARWGSDRSRSKLPFGSQSGVLPSPALIYCPSVPTEMRADDVLPGSHLSLLAPRRWVGAVCRRGVASTADGSRRGRRRPAAGTCGPRGEGARATRGQWCSAGWGPGSRSAWPGWALRVRGSAPPGGVRSCPSRTPQRSCFVAAGVGDPFCVGIGNVNS